MEIINGFLQNFGWPMMYFMAFLLVMALINLVCSFFRVVLKYKRENNRYKI